MKKLFSVVIPVYNGAENLKITIPQILEKIDLFEKYDIEIIMVNDGSVDNSYEVMQELQKQNPEIITIAELTKNCGQAAATACGYTLAKGDVIGIYSEDAQEPFEFFLEMLKEWEAGCKFVYATRKKREDKGLSILFSKMFHKMMHQFVSEKYPKGGSDFFVVDRKILDEYNVIAKNKYCEGLVLFLSLTDEVKAMEYIRLERNSGKSTYSLKKKIDLAISLFISNSRLFHYIIFFVTSGMFMLSVGNFLYGIINRSTVGIIIAAIFFSTGCILFASSVVLEYVRAVFEIEKKKPWYSIKDICEKKSN